MTGAGSGLGLEVGVRVGLRSGLEFELGLDVKSGVGVVDVLAAGELESCIFSCEGSFCVLQDIKPPIIRVKHNINVIDFFMKNQSGKQSRSSFRLLYLIHRIGCII